MRKSHQNEGQPKIYGGNAIWNKLSDVFKVMGSSFQTLGAATEKARLPMINNHLDTQFTSQWMLSQYSFFVFLIAYIYTLICSTFYVLLLL